MEDRVTLYIATHNITGKKYFGKTIKWFTREDLQKNYHGSGKYWSKHKKKHGDKDVTMEIYQICSLNEADADYVVPIALKFSDENNIVKSEDWANLEFENGLNGSRKSVEDYDKIAEKVSTTKSSEEWKETIGKQSIVKRLETMSSEEWKVENYDNMIEKRKINTQSTINDPVWKETIGAEKSKKLKEIMRTDGARRGELQSVTRNSEEWKNTTGKEQIANFKETISKLDWKETVSIPALKKRSEKVNSEEWLNTKGVEKLKNMEKRYLENCKHYDLYDYMTGNLVEHDITPRDFKRYSTALSKTSKEKYLGFTTRSKNKMIRDGKEQYIGLYIVLL